MLCRFHDPTLVIWSDFVGKKEVIYLLFVCFVFFFFGAFLFCFRIRFRIRFGFIFKSDFEYDFEFDFQSDSESDFESECCFPFRQSYFIKLFDASLPCEIIWTFFIWMYKRNQMMFEELEIIL